jgi:hypothetical protein
MQLRRETLRSNHQRARSRWTYFSRFALLASIETTASQFRQQLGPTQLCPCRRRLARFWPFKLQNPTRKPLIFFSFFEKALLSIKKHPGGPGGPRRRTTQARPRRGPKPALAPSTTVTSVLSRSSLVGRPSARRAASNGPGILPPASVEGAPAG